MSKIDFKAFRHKYTIKAYKSQINALKRVLRVYNHLQPNTAGTETGLYMDILSNSEVIQLNHGNGAITYTDILDTLKAVADNNEIDLQTCKQGQFKAITQECGQILFKNNALRLEGENGRLINNGKYDISIVDKIALVYVHICHLYNKYISLYGFGLFANIDYETLNSWKDGDSLSDVSSPTLQKIADGQADSIINKLYDSNNVTGQMMLANNILGWNTSRNQTETTSRVERVSTIETDFLTLLDGQN